MFYIRAPTGEVSLHVLENCIFTRIEYLTLLYEAKTDEFNGNFEYLIEGSVYDKVGHFTLRLLSSVSSDLWNYWIVRETLLFRFRLNHILPKQLHRLFRSILYQLRTLSDKKHTVNRTLSDICIFFLKPLVFKHVASKNHKEDCKVFKTTVRFELIPELIQTREVDLALGYATIYCSNWKPLLVSLFHTYVTKETKCIKSQAQHTINRDPRLDYLCQKIHCQVFQRNHGYGRVTIENIDTEVKNFPPCMQHLHIKLRSVHRLSHYARLYYSLFLKDSGMQIEDAINYWKGEYSKPHTCTSICSHNWHSNERKFIYSIRHLYGLEGSRKNYKSPICEFMCTNSSGPMYEGGCPFKNFDTTTIKNLLCNSLSENETMKLLDATASQKPQTKCAEFFKTLNNIDNEKIVINSPVQYYFMMIDQI